MCFLMLSCFLIEGGLCACGLCIISFGLGCDMNNTGSGLVASQGVMGLVVLLMKLHSAI